MVLQQVSRLCLSDQNAWNLPRSKRTSRKPQTLQDFTKQVWIRWLESWHPCRIPSWGPWHASLCTPSIIEELRIDLWLLWHLKSFRWMRWWPLHSFCEEPTRRLMVRFWWQQRKSGRRWTSSWRPHYNRSIQPILQTKKLEHHGNTQPRLRSFKSRHAILE